MQHPFESESGKRMKNYYDKENSPVKDKFKEKSQIDNLSGFSEISQIQTYLPINGNIVNYKSIN